MKTIIGFNFFEKEKPSPPKQGEEGLFYCSIIY